MAPRGGGRGRAMELGRNASSSGHGRGASEGSTPRGIGRGAAEGSTPRGTGRGGSEGSTPTGAGRGRGIEFGMNGSNSSHISSAEGIGNNLTNVADATSTNVGGLTTLTVSRGLLKPSRGLSGAITSCFKRSLYPRAFAWKMVPEDKKLDYFEEFRKEYTWDPAIESLVHRAWRVKAAIRYKDMVHDFKDMKARGKKPPFITDDEWEHWKAYWLREDVIERSRQAKLNRMSEPEGPGTGLIIHRGGSRSAQDYAMQLSEQLNVPEEKIDWEVFLRYHYKAGEYTDLKSKKIAEEVYRIADEERAPLPGTTEEREVDMNAIYLRVVKALEKKIRLFGQGCRYTTASQSCVSSAGSDFSSAYMEDQISSLQTQLSAEREERLQSQTIQEELKEQLQKQAEEHAQMKAQLEHIMRHWSGPPPPP